MSTILFLLGKPIYICYIVMLHCLGASRLHSSVLQDARKRDCVPALLGRRVCPTRPLDSFFKRATIPHTHSRTHTAAYRRKVSVHTTTNVRWAGVAECSASSEETGNRELSRQKQ
jgi:hypothetical protein